ncbi:MAG: FAD-dependent oxidoreductase, partial [Clostridiales bacterium]|nr:FAD-dependent oxidoreductase [Clostridiales bacterium]
MDRIAVVGGGIAGCSAAYRLYEAGMQVVLIEKSGALGGNIRNFGCKADEKCVRDNLCLVEGVFGKVRAAAATGAASGKAEGGIEIIYDSEVVGLSGKPGDYELQVSRYSRPRRQSITLSGISSIIIATGHIKFSEIETGSFEWTKDDRVIWASRLEELLYDRGPGTIGKNTVGKDTFEKHTPDKNIPDRDSLKKAVFIQCVGSRSVSDCADYCSRVCCGYSYRMARALKYFYKDIQIDMLYMDLQEAGYVQELSFEELDSRGIGHILCRPVSVKRQDSEQ